MRKTKKASPRLVRGLDVWELKFIPNRRSTWIFSSRLHRAVSPGYSRNEQDRRFMGSLDVGNSYSLAFRDFNQQYVSIAHSVFLEF